MTATRLTGWPSSLSAPVPYLAGAALPNGPRASVASMSSLNALDVVRATGIAVHGVGTTWMRSPATAARGEQIGLIGLAYWAAGRGGVLGEVDADVAAAAFGFVHPETFRVLWASRPAGLAPSEATRHYARAGVAWAEQRWAELDHAELTELAVLAETVAAGSWPTVGALFAGWRAVHLPRLSPAARLVLALQVLREHRGGAHLIAVQASGLEPVDAILAAPADRGGPARAQSFGWNGSWADPAEVAARRAQAEDLTDRVAARAYEALDGPQRARFVELVEVVSRATIV